MKASAAYAPPASPIPKASTNWKIERTSRMVRKVSSNLARKGSRSSNFPIPGRLSD